MDAVLALLGFVLLCGAAVLGYSIHARLPTHHRTRETLAFTRLVIGLLVTFVALTLGLLVASVNAGFEKTSSDLQDFAADIIRLTTSFEEIGPPTIAMREDLRTFTASLLIGTWPHPALRPEETLLSRARPYDFDSSRLGDMLHRIAIRTMSLPEDDAVRRLLKVQAIDRVEEMEGRRWTLIGEAHHTITPPLLALTVLWLVVIFLGFGLNAPRDGLSKTSIILAALCVSGAFYVLLELDGPLDGSVKVSGDPLRHALRHLDESLGSADRSESGSMAQAP